MIKPKTYQKISNKIKNRFQHIPGSVFAISTANFLVNISTALVFALSTGYMKTQLHTSSEDIVWLQNSVDVLSYIIKVLSGILSDFMRRRKIIVIIGILCITMAKPMLAISVTAVMVFWARVLDRFGNGIQSSPRDALVGDVSEAKIRGRCFGLKHSFATLGSFIGSILSFGLMELTGSNYKFIFFMGALPCILALIVFGVGVRDPHFEDKPIDLRSMWKKMVEQAQTLKHFNSAYWKLIFVTLIFMACRFSESVLILTAIDRFGVSASKANIVVILYNSTMSLITYPAGFFSDRFGRKPLLLIGFAVMAFSQFILGLSDSFTSMSVGVLLWGIQRGITESTTATLISDYVQKEHRGTAFSLFHLVNALGMWIAGNMFIYCNKTFISEAGFFYGTVIGLVSFVMAYFFIAPTQK